MKYLKEYNEYHEEVYYHGSPYKLDTLKAVPPSSGESKFLGEGIYISNDRNVSEKYSKDGYLYQVTLREPLIALDYFEYIDIDKLKSISSQFEDSSNSDLNYIGENIKDDIENDDLWTGKQLITEIEREGLNSNDVLLELGYNAIVCPINRINQFMMFPDESKNINVIKDGILNVSVS